MKKQLSLGVTFALLSALSYAILAVIIKVELGSVPVPITVFVQSLVTLLLIVPFVIRNPKAMKTSIVSTHIFRAIFSLGISYFLFAAVMFMPLVNAMLILNIAPMIVPFVALILMGRSLNHKIWVPIAIGLVGVAFVLNPNAHGFNMASLLAIGAAISMAGSVVLVRKAGQSDSTLTILFYYFLLSTVISGLVATKFWIPLPVHDALILLLTGGLFFVVQGALVLAVKFSNAEIVSTLYNSNVVFAALLAIIIWHKHLSLGILAGIILVTVGAILTIRAEGRRKLIITTK